MFIFLLLVTKTEYKNIHDGKSWVGFLFVKLRSMSTPPPQLFSKPQKFIGACHLSEDKLILNVHSLQPNICWIILPFQWNQTLTKTISLFCLAFSIYSHVCRESDGAGKGWKLLDGWANNAKWDGKRMHLPLSKCTVVQFDNQMLEILASLVVRIVWFTMFIHFYLNNIFSFKRRCAA